MIFESKHSLLEQEFKMTYPKALSFPLHIHRAFEFFQQICGTTEVVIGEKRYVLKEGDAVLVFPLQPHSYTSITEGQICLCIFSPDRVPEFYKKNENRTPVEHLFRCRLPAELSLDTEFHQTAVAYYICGEFERGREYRETVDRQEHRLLLALLLFADRNFCTACLLRDAAAEAGYDYAYVSKFFKRRVGCSFRQYVNRLRINESKRRLRTEGKSMEEIGTACGFSSMRTFDREFRAQVGMTPSEYKRWRLSVGEDGQ